MIVEDLVERRAHRHVVGPGQDARSPARSPAAAGCRRTRRTGSAPDRRAAATTSWPVAPSRNHEATRAAVGVGRLLAASVGLFATADRPRATASTQSTTSSAIAATRRRSPLDVASGLGEIGGAAVIHRGCRIPGPGLGQPSRWRRPRRRRARPAGSPARPTASITARCRFALAPASRNDRSRLHRATGARPAARPAPSRPPAPRRRTLPRGTPACRDCRPWRAARRSRSSVTSCSRTSSAIAPAARRAAARRGSCRAAPRRDDRGR